MPSARAVPVGSRHGQRLYGRHRHPRGRSAQPHGPALSLFALEQNGTEDWYMAGLQFDDRTQYQIREAWNHLTPHQRKNHTHGHLIASLTFGFWRNLLEDGGTIHTRSGQTSAVQIMRTIYGAKDSIRHSPMGASMPVQWKNAGRESTRWIS